MKTDCNAERFEFQALGSRPVIARFDGGIITSDGGLLLLREVEARRQIISQFAACFTDHRDPRYVEHSVAELVAQRVYALALGYEDLNDHDDLRGDWLLAAAVGKADPTGGDRRQVTDRGKALAGKSTLNRLELRSEDPQENGRYKKIEVHAEQIEQCFLKVFLGAYPKPPSRIVLDLDVTDDPLHGQQEGRFFHGYYREYCYLPLYVFCGDFLLVARLRTADHEASAGVVDILKGVVSQLRQAWPEVKMLVRGDSAFAREELMAWCEANGSDYLFGLARNARLERELTEALVQARHHYEQTQQAARVFKEFSYQRLESWSRARRVVGKAEHLAKGPNPRFVVTSLPTTVCEAPQLYEHEYCARGEMENRIKEQKQDLRADKTSTHKLRSNQLRLWLTSIAYVLLNELRRLGLAGTELAHAQCQTLRSKLLKLGAQITVTARRVVVSLSSACPYQELVARIYRNLLRVQVLRC
jgi:hypothetical protein